MERRNQSLVPRRPSGSPVADRLAQRPSHCRAVRQFRAASPSSTTAKVPRRSSGPAVPENRSPSASSQEWSQLRCVKVRQVAFPDTIIRVPISEPGESLRALRALRINAEDFEALTTEDDFQEFDNRTFGHAVDSVRRMSEPPTLEQRKHYDGVEAREAQFRNLGSGISTWVYCTPGNDEDTFVIRVSARFGRMLLAALESLDCKYSWRLCSGVARSLPEVSSFGINSVDIDGAMQAPTPAGFKLELMPHQQRSLSWMLRREKIGMDELCVSECRTDQPIECIGLDLRLELKRENSFCLRGGLLCDAIGSGKTATVLALVLQGSSYTYIPSRCRSGSEDCATSTKATLVLCPSNIHAQWLSETSKFCPDKLRRVSLRTLEDLRMHSVADLMEADLVVAPYDIFAPNHQVGALVVIDGLEMTHGSSALAADLNGKKAVCEGWVEDIGRWSVRIENGRIEVLEPQYLKICVDGGHNLEQMCWHRLVLDEFHELCSKRNPTESQRNETILRAIRSLEVAKRWGVSGTPESFTNSSASVAHASRFFRCDVNIRSAAIFIENFCRQARIRLPVDVHEHTIMIRQTAEEQAVYYEQQMGERLPSQLDWGDLDRLSGRAAQVQRALMLCSHFTTSVGGCDPCLTAEQVCEQMLQQKRDSVTDAQQLLLQHISANPKPSFDGESKFHQLAQKVADMSCGHSDGMTMFITTVEGEHFHETATHFELICTRLYDADIEDECFIEVLADLTEASNTVISALDALETLPKLDLKETPLQIHVYIDKIIKQCSLTLQAQRNYSFFKKTLATLHGKGGGETCPICLEEVNAYSAYILFCGHTICTDCAPRLISDKCPVCRCAIPGVRGYSIKSNLLTAVPPRLPETATSAEIPPEHAHWSSKLRAFVETLESIRSRELGAKIIVFTQWDCLRVQTSRVLNEIGFQHLLLQGNIFTRTRVLEKFQHDASISLLLLSLEDSASGTNLTSASHVFLMHPMLAASPEEATSYEAQAIGRVVRLGQTRPVHVWRFITAGTVEERLWRIRETELSTSTHESSQ